MFRFLLIPLLFLAACDPAGPQPERASRAAQDLEPLPPMKVFAAQPAPRATRPNSELQRDFLDLSFQMESGRALPTMSRFEGPISLRVTGAPPPSLAPDLRRLLDRLKAEAGISITQVPPTTQANITIEALPQSRLQGLVPQAACFVVPRVTSWAEFRSRRRSRTTDWSTLETRERVTIFVPSDVSPQELRDCLHEEIAQALGPLNDLYRLPDSVFNDDNFHAVLTGFDMLMLRTYYAPELRSGMSRDEAATVVPALLNRLNPAGRGGGSGGVSPTPRAWITAIETALGPRTGNGRRLASAREAVDIARARGWRDNRLAFALFTYGRIVAGANPEATLAAFQEARALYLARPETRLHAAHVATHLANFSLSAGQAEITLRLVDQNIGVVAKAENAALLSTLLMIRAEALLLQGRVTEARTARLDSLGWARYGFGSQSEVRARLNEIASIVPRAPASGG